jgi:hypothetical protein
MTGFGELQNSCDIASNKGESILQGLPLLIFYGFLDICNRDNLTSGCVHGKLFSIPKRLKPEPAL